MNQDPAAPPAWASVHKLEPHDVEELRVAVARSAAERTRMVVTGNSTKLDWGPPPEGVDLMVSTARLNRILEHRSGDLVAIVEPGVRLRDLDDQLAAHGQYWAVDEVVPDSTVGGVIGLALSGPRRYRYGTIRDLVLGMSVIDSSGTLTRSGAAVVKNVAGFDVGKLMIGALGTLGVVASVTLRLHPRPAREQWYMIESDFPAALVEGARRIRQPAMDPVAVEWEWNGDGGRLAVLLAGDDEVILRQADQARRYLGVDVRPCPAPPHPWRHRIRNGQVWIKVTVRISGAADVCEYVTQARRGGHNVSLSGSPGVGVFYVTVDGVKPSVARDVLGALRRLATGHGGSAVLMAGGDQWCDAAEAWGPVGGLPLMRRVKSAFDPHRLFAPGRFVGGI